MILGKIKVLFDTNIVVDILCKRSVNNINNLFSSNINLYCKSFIVSKQITDIYYILRKYEKDRYKRMDLIKNVLVMFNILDFNKVDIEDGIKLSGPDFEDDVLIATALNNKIDCIISNNYKDFIYCNKIKTFNPDDFINFVSSMNEDK